MNEVIRTRRPHGAGDTGGEAASRSPPRLLLPARTRSAERLRIWLFGTLFLLDCLCITFGFITAGAIWLGSPFEEQGLRTLAVILPMFVALALNNGSYSLESLERPAVGTTQSVKALLYACGVAIVLLFYLKWSTQFSRMVFAAGTLMSVSAMIGARWVFVTYAGRKLRWTFRNRLIIVDDMVVTPHPGDSIVLADQFGIEPGKSDPMIRHRLGEIMEGFDSVVLACTPERRRKWTYTLHGAAADVEVLVPELARLGAVEFRSLHGEPTLVVSSRPLSVRDRVLKRSLDLAVAVAALVVLAPVMCVAAIAIRLESPGPILFRQQRVGKNNKLFNLLKFRSMRAEAADPTASRLVSASDDRVTLVGKFLRGTSLDELPQLFNVLAGDMSIVGPRPHALGATAEKAAYWDIDRRYFYRHSIKPGLTGLAQIRGFRGETAHRDDLTNRVQSDLEYLSRWTVWRDLRIIFSTFFVLVHAKAF